MPPDRKVSHREKATREARPGLLNLTIMPRGSEAGGSISAWPAAPRFHFPNPSIIHRCRVPLSSGSGDGKVISAEPGYKGTNILDENLLEAARKAALKARFNASSDAAYTQAGTITYHFVLQ